MRKLMIVSALLAGAFTANSNAPRTEAATDAFGIETGLSYISVASVDFSGRFVVLEALPYFEHLPSGAPRERVRVDRVKHTTTPLPTLIAVGNGGWYGITPDGRWLDIAAGTSTPAPAGAEYLMAGDGQLYVVVTASGPSLIVDGRSGATSAVPLSGRPVAISNNGRYVLTGTCSTSQPPVLECHDYRRWDRFLGDVDAIYTSTDARVLHAVGDNGRVAVVDRSRNPFPPPERIYDTITVHGPEGFVRSFKAGFPSAMSADGNYLVVYANCGIDSCMISAVEIESGSTQVIARDSFGIVGPVLLSGTGSSTAYVRNGVGESISRVVVEGDAIKGAPVVGHVLAGEVFELPPTGSSQQAQTQVLNVTVTNPSSDGYLTVWPCGEPIPATSNLNFAAGQTVANATVTAVGENGAICFTSNAQLDLIVDRSGAFASAESFHAVSPRRLEDTRTSAASGRVRRGTILAVPMPADVRQNAIAVALNITIVNPAQDGYVTVWPCGTPPPATSNGNFAVGQTVALATITAVANDGTVCVVSNTDADVVVDLQGSFDPSTMYHPVGPTRVRDTRSGSATANVGAGESLRIPVVDAVALGSDVSAVSITVTATNPTQDGYVTVWSCDGPAPLASTLNFVTGQTVANLSLSGVDERGAVCVTSNTRLDVIVDVSGWFGPSSPYVPDLNPNRLEDTRHL